MTNQLKVTATICLFLSGLVSCAEKSKEQVEERKEQPVSFDDYFRIEKENKSFDNNGLVLQFNQALDLQNQLNDSLVLEVRVISSQMFRNSYYYRLVRTNKGSWSGEKHVLEYITFKHISDTAFTPRSGWKTFEKTIAENDILHSGNSYLEKPMEQRAFHPKTYLVQIVQRNSSCILDYGPFYEYLNSDRSKEEEFLRMKRIMNSIF